MKHSVLFLVLFGLLGMQRSMAFTVTLETYPETCGNANGAVISLVENGTAPITYDWSNGTIADAIFDLVPGVYSLTVTDGTGAQQTVQTEVLAVNNLERPSELQVPQAGHFGCGGCGIGMHAPYDMEGAEYYWPNVEWPVMVVGAPIMTQFDENNAVYGPYCMDDAIALQFVDATGCAGSIPLHQPFSYNMPGGFGVLNVMPACNGLNGAVTLDVNSGGSMPGGWNVRMENAASGVVADSDISMFDQVTFTGIPAGTYDVIRRIPVGSAYPGTCPPETLSVTVPDLGVSCGTISGRVFIDHDQDCSFETTDHALSYAVLEILPGPIHAITNADGTYGTNLLFGDYTIAPVASADLIPVCPPQSPAEFTIDALNTAVLLDLADSSSRALDVAVDLASGPARPGFVVNYHGHVRNLGGQLSGPMDITMEFDPLLTFVGAQPTPTSVTGGTITWSGVAALGAFATKTVHVQLQVPPDAGLLGSQLVATLSVLQPIPEADDTNNLVLHAVTVTGSYDPNAKTVATSSRASDELFFIGQDEWLDYTIQFQNTGTDTAFTVVVTDTLPATLDLATFQQGVASHPFTINIKPGRVVEWRFGNIQLPDSNVNEPASHGFIGFRIRPHLPIAPGTTIENIANIYFDFNPPVITEPSVLVAEFSTGVGRIPSTTMHIAPNPATDILRVTLQTALRTNAQVLSVDGRTIAVPITQQAHALELDVRFLAPGPYLIRTEQGTARFVKQ